MTSGVRKFEVYYDHKMVGLIETPAGVSDDEVVAAVAFQFEGEGLQKPPSDFEVVRLRGKPQQEGRPVLILEVEKWWEQGEPGN